MSFILKVFFVLTFTQISYANSCSKLLGSEVKYTDIDFNNLITTERSINGSRYRVVLDFGDSQDSVEFLDVVNSEDLFRDLGEVKGRGPFQVRGELVETFGLLKFRYIEFISF